MKIYVKASADSNIIQVAKNLQSKIREYRKQWGHAIYTRLENHKDEGVCITVNPAVGQHTTSDELKEITSTIIDEVIADAKNDYPEFNYTRGTSGSGGYRSPRFPCIWITKKGQTSL